MSTLSSVVLKLINRANGVNYNINQVKMGPAAVNENQEIHRNSCLFMSTLPGVMPSGTILFYYDRHRFDDCFVNITPKLAVKVGDVVTTSMIASMVADKYGLELDATDVIGSNDIVIDTLPKSVEIVAVAGNHGWEGKVTVQLVAEEPKLEEVLTVKTLNGINPPSSVLTKTQAAIYSWDFVVKENIPFWQNLVMDSLVDNAFVAEFNKLAPDTWLLAEEETIFNLEGAKIIYNGIYKESDIHNQLGGNPDHPSVVAVELSDKCNNVGGILLIGYEV